MSVYPLSSPFLHGNKGSPVEQSERQRSKNISQHQWYTHKAAKFIGSLSLYLFPENKSIFMVIFTENLAKVDHCSRTYLLTGKFLPRVKTYTHRKKSSVDNKNTDPSSAIALCLTLLSSSQYFLLIFDNIHSATAVLLLSLMAIKQKILHNAEETS